LDEFEREDKIKIAQALKAYWIKEGKWTGGISKKQKTKGSFAVYMGKLKF